MKPIQCAPSLLIAILFLAGCAGTPRTPVRAGTPQTPAPATAPAPARPAAPSVFRVTFDAAGNAFGPDGIAVTREHLVALLSGGKLDRHTVIKIEVPQMPTREQSIEAFARANRVVKIFDLYGFESVLVALAKP